MYRNCDSEKESQQIVKTGNIANSSSLPVPRTLGFVPRATEWLHVALATVLSCAKDNKHSDVCSCNVYICLAPILHVSTEQKAMATQRNVANLTYQSSNVHLPIIG